MNLRPIWRGLVALARGLLLWRRREPTGLGVINREIDAHLLREVAKFNHRVDGHILQAIQTRTLALGLVLLPALAHAQGIPGFQSGTIPPNHLQKNAGPGQYMDVGGIYGDVNGRGASPFAITDSLGPGLCAHSAVTGGSHHEFCIGHDSSGNAQLSITANGGAAEAGFNVLLNGTAYPWPGSGNGNILGPSSSTANHLPAWDNSGGTLLKDPGTAALSAAGLNVAVGAPPGLNSAGTAVQVYQVTSSVDSAKSSSGLYARNVWGGSDGQANVNGVYGILWYQGAAGNQAMGIRGNVYTAADGAILGTVPNQYIDGPGVGTVTYMAGVYGRPAHYLPGTVTYAASFFADGLYNISTPVGGAVTDFANVLAIPPYAKAVSNFVLQVIGASCSPTCYTATIYVENDPIVLATGAGAARDIEFRPGQAAAFVKAFAPLVGGAGEVCQTVVQGGATAGAMLANGANCGLTMTSLGTGILSLSQNNQISASFISVPSAVNYVQTTGAATGQPPTIASQGEANVNLVIAPKGSGQVAVGSATAGSFGVYYAASDASVAGNFSATKYILIKANGVAFYVPAMAAPW